MAIAFAFALALAVPAAVSAQAAVPLQMGVGISPDSVTVGQHFVVVLKVRAPRGATIEFPMEIDSATAASATATRIIGKPVVQAVPDSMGAASTAAYRLAAWDTGPQRFGLGDVVVRLGTDTKYISTASYSVHVNSVLPDDSALRVSKPPRAAIEILPFNWIPLVILALALVAAALLWRLLIWYRRRRAAPLDPFTRAEREFMRVAAMGLVAAGEGERHAALMSDVMRDYLAERVDGIERSHTSSELLAASGQIHSAARGLGELLWRTDLIKFAGIRVPPDEAEKLGSASRSVVGAVESHLVETESEAEEKRAA